VRAALGRNRTAARCESRKADEMLYDFVDVSSPPLSVSARAAYHVTPIHAIRVEAVAIMPHLSLAGWALPRYQDIRWRRQRVRWR